MKTLSAGLLITTLACAALLALSGPAAASPSQLTIVDAGKEATGLYGERRRGAAVRDLDALGADVIRIVIYWIDVAPKPHATRPPRGFHPTRSNS